MVRGTIIKCYGNRSGTQMGQDGRTCGTRGEENTMEIQLHGATAHPCLAPSEEVVRELLMGTTRPAAQEPIAAADSRVQQKGHMGHAK
jgi:hypothetical protein